MHLVLQGQAKMSDNKVSGREDTMVSEMIKILLLENIYTITRCFQERFVAQIDSPSSWKIVKLGFPRNQDAILKKETRSYRARALTSVTSKWYASCVMMRMERRNCQKLGRDFTWKESAT